MIFFPRASLFLAFFVLVCPCQLRAETLPERRRAMIGSGQYYGPAAVLLSEDVIHGERNIAGEWRALMSEVEVQALTGSHLECITAHVDTLAQTIEDCLQRSVRGAHPSNRQSGSTNSASS